MTPCPSIKAYHSTAQLTYACVPPRHNWGLLLSLLRTNLYILQAVLLNI